MAHPNNNNQIIERMHEYYRAKKMPECKKCGANTNVIPVVFGRPNKDLAYLFNFIH